MFRIPSIRICSAKGGGGGRTRRWLSNGPAVRPKPKDRFVYPEGMIPYEEDYVEQPQYPEIDEETHTWTEIQRRGRQEVLNWHKKIRDAPNPEAKTVEINKPRQYGWRTHTLNEERFEYDSDLLYKFLTRSHVAEGELPSIYADEQLTKQAKYYAEKLGGPLLETLKFELNEQSRSYEKDIGVTEKEADFKRSQSIVSQLNRVILNLLARDVEHLADSRVDVAPKMDAFWFVGGQLPVTVERKAREASMKLKNYQKYKGKVDDPVERSMQYKGSPLLQLRCENPISNFVPANSPLCSTKEDVPDRFPYHLSHYSLFKDFNYASFIPGTWATDSHKCSHIAFHPRHHLLDTAVQQSQHWIDDAENALSSQTILASFGRLISQALYFGFDQFNGLEYPFSSQTIITDGVKWSFSAYQLNTIGLDELSLPKNKKQNICWKLNTMSLLDNNDPNKLNNPTLETLLKFYLNKPSPIPVENPTPYLKSPLPDWEDEIQREVVFYNYRDMVANRWKMMHILKRQYPEIYEWEWIYKINHKQRHMEPRRRFFEFPSDFPGRNPYDTPYQLLNPRHVGKRMKFLMEEVAQRKEQERIEAAKKAESAKYGVVDDDLSKKKKKK